MRRRKPYRKTWDVRMGRILSLHQHLAAQALGRPLLPGEVVHHRDGDSLNNAPGNLLVLPSQRLHAHLEHLLRRERGGQPPLFPKLLGALREGEWAGTLFAQIVTEEG